VRQYNNTRIIIESGHELSRSTLVRLLFFGQSWHNTDSDKVGYLFIETKPTFPHAMSRSLAWGGPVLYDKRAKMWLVPLEESGGHGSNPSGHFGEMRLRRRTKMRGFGESWTRKRFVPLD